MRQDTERRIDLVQAAHGNGMHAKSLSSVLEMQAAVFADGEINTKHTSKALMDPTFQRFAIIGRFVGNGARYKTRKPTHLNYHTYKVLSGDVYTRTSGRRPRQWAMFLGGIYPTADQGSY